MYVSQVHFVDPLLTEPREFKVDSAFSTFQEPTLSELLLSEAVPCFMRSSQGLQRCPISWERVLLWTREVLLVMQFSGIPLRVLCLGPIQADFDQHHNLHFLGYPYSEDEDSYL